MGEYYGRITRHVAYFLLAKLALNAEVYTDDVWTDNLRPNGADIEFTIDGTRANAWEATIYYCDKIAEAGYNLEPDYRTNYYIPISSFIYSGRVIIIMQRLTDLVERTVRLPLWMFLKHSATVQKMKIHDLISAILMTILPILTEIL